MKKEYCDWAGEEVDKEEHEDCICRKCSYCGNVFRGNKWELNTHTSVWLHKGCVLDWLEDNGEIVNVEDERE